MGLYNFVATVNRYFCSHFPTLSANRHLVHTKHLPCFNSHIIMDLPHVGTHCSVSGRNLLDFLPFTCARCKVVTCVSHKEDHSCSRPVKSGTTVACPSCSRLLPVKPSDNADAVVDAHIAG